MASIIDFQSALKESARGTQFRVTINFPTSVANGVEATRVSTFLTYEGRIPQVTVTDIVLKYRGKQYHEAGDKEFQTWGCSIYNDIDFTVRGALEDWSELIRSGDSTDGASYPTEYKSTVTIEQLNRAGDTVRTYTLHGAWPSDLGEIALNFDGSEIENYQATFTYDYFTSASE